MNKIYKNKFWIMGIVVILIGLLFPNNKDIKLISGISLMIVGILLLFNSKNSN